MFEELKGFMQVCSQWRPLQLFILHQLTVRFNGYLFGISSPLSYSIEMH